MRLDPVLVTAPAALAVSLEEFKLNARVVGTSEDAQMTDMLEDAISFLDGPNGALSRCLMPQQWRLDVAAPLSGCVRVPFSPVRSIASASYIDRDGASQSFDVNADLMLMASEFEAWIEPAYGSSWPAARPVANAYSFTLDCGYASAAAIPTRIRRAILMLAGHFYENREASAIGVSVAEVPMAVRDIVQMERRGWAA